MRALGIIGWIIAEALEVERRDRVWFAITHADLVVRYPFVLVLA